MKYQMDARVRYSEIGENGKLTLPGLINYFQDCTTFHSEEVGSGAKALRKKQRAWVLSAWQIHVRRYPEFGEKIKVVTFPHSFKGFLGGRNFTMENESGELLAAADSQWVYVDLQTGHPCRIEAEELAVYPLEEKLEENFSDRKIKKIDGGTAFEPFTVKKQHLDTNHHVNNGQYVNLAMEYLTKDIEVKNLRAEYKQQALLGDVLYPCVSEIEAGCQVVLNSAEGKPYLLAEFTE